MLFPSSDACVPLQHRACPGSWDLVGWWTSAEETQEEGVRALAVRAGPSSVRPPLHENLNWPVRGNHTEVPSLCPKPGGKEAIEDPQTWLKAKIDEASLAGES